MWKEETAAQFPQLTPCNIGEYVGVDITIKDKVYNIFISEDKQKLYCMFSLDRKNKEYYDLSIKDAMDDADFEKLQAVVNDYITKNNKQACSVGSGYYVEFEQEQYEDAFLFYLELVRTFVGCKIVNEVYKRYNNDSISKVSQRFFIPYEGKDYKLGIKGKKILVVGASFYCDKQNCTYFRDCTNPVKKDSSPYNTICPEYTKNGAVLEKEPEYAIDENYPAYQRFAECMKQFVEPDVNVWNRMAFTNYVQFFVPTVKTDKTYLSQRDFEAFIESVIQLQPDVIISWGMVTIDAVRDNNNYIIDREKLKDSEWYICHMKMDEVKHNITLVCCFHPSSPDWNQDFEKLTRYLRKVLEDQ